MGKTGFLTGIARSKGKAAGEALVNRQRIGWAFNHVGNEDGMVMAPGADTQGQIVTGKIFVYPTTAGSTSGAALASALTSLTVEGVTGTMTWGSDGNTNKPASAILYYDGVGTLFDHQD